MSPELLDKLTNYLSKDTTFRAIYDYTKQRFDAAKHLTAHNWEHAYRDTINAIAIGEAEGADMSIVLPAAVMHDIGFLYGATGKTHGAVGADKLPEYLAEGGLHLNKSKIDLLADCIRTHKGSMHGEEPETLEAKVVSDADMLEKFGPIGVYQTIRTFTEFNFGTEKTLTRLATFNELEFQTETGQRLAQSQRQYVAQFAKELQQTYAPYQVTEASEEPS
jgi:uncharacterized protein